MIEAWFDGVCEPRNPGGHAAWGALCKVDGRVVYAKGGYVGVGPKMSNNVAEYSGFIEAILQVTNHPGPAIIRGDSKLVMYHLVPDPSIGRKWQMNGGLYLPYYEQAVKLYERELRLRKLELEWVPRAQNDECDALSKKVLLDRGVQFRIQPQGKVA